MYRDAKGSNKPTERLINQTTNNFITAISTKAISDKIAIYCINRVLLPKLQYLWKFSVLSQSFLQSVDRKIRNMARSKLGLAKSTPNSVLYHQHIYNLQSVVQAHQHDHIIETIMQLNDHTLLGKIARIRLLQLQNQCHTTTLPLTKPSLEPTGKGYFAKVQPLLVRMSLHIEPLTSPPGSSSNWGQVKGGSKGLDVLLPHFEMKKFSKTLRDNDIWFVDQLTSIDNKKYLNLADLKLSNKPKSLAKVINTLQQLFGPTPLREEWDLGSRNPHFENAELQVAASEWKEKSFAMHLSEESGSEPTIYKIERLLLDQSTNSIRTAICQHFTALQPDDVAGMEDWLEAMTVYRFFWQCEGCSLKSTQIHQSQGTCLSSISLSSLHPAILNKAGTHVLTSLKTIQHHQQQPKSKQIYGLDHEDEELESIRNHQYGSLEREDQHAEERHHLARQQNAFITILGEKEQTNNSAAVLQATSNTSLNIFTDGSLINGSNMGVGLFTMVPGQDNPVALSFRLKNLPASSYTAELAGLLLGHLFENSAISITLDNQAVVTTYNNLYERGLEPSPKQLLKTPNGYFWSLITKLRQLQTGSKPTVKWIKGHDGNKGNEEADRLAGNLNSPQLDIKLSSQPALPFILGTAKTFIYGQVRKELKEMSYIKNHHEWINQPMFSFLRPSHQWNFELTFLVLHGGIKPSHQFSTMSESHKRKFRVQLLHRLLPTQKEMHRRLPSLYPDGQCRVCLKEEESFSHIFHCQHSINHTKQILLNLATALSNIITDSDEDSAWSKASTWLQLPSLDYQHEQSLSTLSGLVPQEWVNKLREAGTTSATATKQLVKAMRNTYQLVHQNIWIPRCESTVNWEKQNNITQMMKQTHKKSQKSTNTGPKSRRTKHECDECRGRHLNDTCPSDIQTAREAAVMWSDGYLGIRKVQVGIVGISKSGLSEVDTVVGDEALKSVGKQVHVEK